MKIIDVTLRENIEFDGLLDYDLALNYLEYVVKHVSNEDIQYIELGYIDTEWYDHPQYNEEYLKNAFAICGTKFCLSAMIHPDKIDISKWNIDLISKLSIIRIVNQDDEISDNIKDIISYVHSIGVKVSVNIAYISHKTMDTIMKMYNTALDYGADIVYCADSSGSKMPAEIEDIIKLLKKQRRNNMLGMHFHDHLNLSVANAIVAYNNNLDFIDISITGDGKGGGNLKSEFFLLLKRLLDKKHITNDTLFMLLDYIEYYENLIKRYDKCSVQKYLNFITGVYKFKSSLKEQIELTANGNAKEYIYLIINNKNKYA